MPKIQMSDDVKGKPAEMRRRKAMGLKRAGAEKRSMEILFKHFLDGRQVAVLEVERARQERSYRTGGKSIENIRAGNQPSTGGFIDTARQNAHCSQSNSVRERSEPTGGSG